MIPDGIANKVTLAYCSVKPLKENNEPQPPIVFVGAIVLRIVAE